MKKYLNGFTDEERRIRVRKAELGLTVKAIAAAIGIAPQDVTNVIRGRSQSPRYIAEVYKYLGLERPVELEVTQK